jgi:hypothetical protein
VRERQTDAARPRLGARQRTFLVWFAVLFGLSLLWSLASPLFSGPDEPDHIMRAETVLHGQLVGQQTDPPNGGWRIVQAPDVLRISRQIVGCFAFEPAKPACGPAFAGSHERTSMITRAGAAPPFYYALVGPPIAVSPTGDGVFATRLLSNAIASALLAGAFTIATSRGGAFTMLGLLIGVTPMVLFLNSVVNPSSLEIASAALVWVAGLALLDPRTPGGVVEPATLVAFVLGAVMLVLTRPLSPLWLALIAGVLLLTSSWSRVRALLARTDVRTGAAVTAVATVAAVVWLQIYKPLQGDNITPTGVSGLSALRVSFSRLGDMWRQIVGVFGWLDAPSPLLVLIVWCAALVGLIVVAFAVGSVAHRWALVSALVVAVVVPPLIQSTQLDTSQPIWQGRYTLPLALGIPLVAGWTVDRSRHRFREVLRQRAQWLVAALAVGHVVAFVYALRRYTVGVDGPIWYFGHEVWEPKLPAAILAMAFVTLCGVVVVLASRTLAAAPVSSQLVPVDDEGTIDLDRLLVLSGSERPGGRDGDGVGGAGGAGGGPGDEDLLVDGTAGR